MRADCIYVNCTATQPCRINLPFCVEGKDEQCTTFITHAAVSAKLCKKPIPPPGAPKPPKERPTMPQQGLRQILPLRDHQIKGVERYGDKKIAPIFFEAGCGKTATVLRICKEFFDRGEIDSVLVVAPNRIHTQWHKQEIPKWLSDMHYNSQIFGGYGGAKAIRDTRDTNVMQILCVNIDTFSTFNKWENVVQWTRGRKYYFVLDESTTIKNIKSKRTQRLLYSFNTIKKRGRVVVSSDPSSVARAILTGTPVTNSVVDLWAMFEFLQPNYWGRNYYSFQNHYCMMMTMEVEGGRNIHIPLNEDVWNSVKAMRDDQYYAALTTFGISEEVWFLIKSQAKWEGPNKNIQELKKLLDVDSMFVKLIDCEDMPEQNFVRRMTSMTDEQWKAYTELEQELITEYDDKQCTISIKVALYMRLQQIASGFISLDPDIPEPDEERFGDDWEAAYEQDIMPREIRWFKSVPKLDQMYLDIEGAEGPKIIVTKFTAEAARIYEDLSKKYKCCLMTGWRKIGTVEEFQQGKYEIMVANVAVVRMGLNLQVSHNLFFYSVISSLEDREQTERRIWRMGQKKHCNYYDYVADGTIDMKLHACVRQRRNVSEYIKGKSIKQFLNEYDDIVKDEFGTVTTTQKDIVDMAFNDALSVFG